MRESEQQCILHQWQVVSVGTLRWHARCWNEGSGTQSLSGAPLTFFRVTARPLRALSTHLCNWSGTSEKHRPPHAPRARMQDSTAHPSTPWTLGATRAGNPAGSRQMLLPELFTLRHSPLLSYRLSTSTCEDQAQTLKTPFPFDTHLLFRVSFRNIHCFTASPSPISSSFTTQGTNPHAGPTFKFGNQSVRDDLSCQ